jgi:hypothetical protein
MTSTVIAMCYGPIIRLLTQPGKNASENKDRLVIRIIQKLFSPFAKEPASAVSAAE